MKVKDLQIDAYLGGGLVVSHVYSFVAPDGTNTHIACRLLRDWCLKNGPEVFWTPIEGDCIQQFKESNSINMARVKALRPQDRMEPILYCKDGTVHDNGYPNVFLVDGHHRYMRAYLEGEKLIRAWALDVEQWLPFKIEDHPEITQQQLRDADTSRFRNYWKKK